MARTITSVSIDPVLLDKCKKLNIGISPALNRLLQGLVCQYDEADVDIFKLKEKQEEIKKKLFSLKEQEQEIQAQITAFEERQKQKNKDEIKQRLKEAEMIKRSGVMERD